ncbi:polysaccharide deacetylase family protein [Streptomyces sp. NPDC049555]|uniref:polysaccharide deacetylase family protein n=1 Tax=Streptomyces sp. NPDC049555 TaxID=3154930 RepID=UPI00343125F2
MTAQFVVSVHDVAPWSFSRTREWVAELECRDVPATLLLVPGAWRGVPLADDPALVRWLHAAARRGHELAQHGFTHRAVPGGPRHRRLLNRLLARGCAEFCALGAHEAADRLARGRAELARAGIHPEGFTPPGWLASPGTMAALRASGLAYTTSHLAVHDLRTGRRHRLPALCHRPGGLGEHAAARLLPWAACRWARRGRSFRIALHPADLARPGLRESALAAIDAALAAGAEPLTYAELVAVRRRTTP